MRKIGSSKSRKRSEALASASVSDLTSTDRTGAISSRDNSGVAPSVGRRDLVSAATDNVWAGRLVRVTRR